jgi:TonB-dependent receptor
LKRSSGTTIQDGKYAIVRGLNERYNLALVNGAMLPGSEPDKKVFSFDIFPAGMLDNLIIIKTAQPDLPGEFAGGIIRMNTKDVPDSNFINFSLSGGYHQLATFNTFYRPQGSTSDWLGFDNGKGPGARIIPNEWPKNLQELAALNNSQKYDITRKFNNNWNPNELMAFPNTSMQMSGGFRQKMGNNELGVIGGINYNYTQRVNYQQVNSFDEINKEFNYTTIGKNYKDTIYNTEINWGAMLNFSYRIGATNRIFLKNAFNITSDNVFVRRQGYFNTDFTPAKRYQIDFTSNKLLTSQIGGDHLLGASKLRLDWTGSYSRMDRSQPDFKRTSYQGNYINSGPDSGKIQWAFNPNSAANTDDGYRFFATMWENVANVMINLTQPFEWGGYKHEIKAGYSYQHKERAFTARPLGFKKGMGLFKDSIRYQGLDSIFGPWNAGDNGLMMDEITNPGDRYSAKSILNAAYVSLNNKITTDLKAIWGFRFEAFDQELAYDSSINKKKYIFNKFPALLPSLNLVYSLGESANLRFAASKTLSRPEFREIAPFAFYDFDLFKTVAGNDSLKQAKITNIDLRYETFGRMGQMFSVGVFYKRFTKPIEQFLPALGSNIISWLNSPNAQNFGFEVVWRKNLEELSMAGLGGIWKDMTINSNLALISSRISIPYANITKGDYLRPMQGQSPFILNVALQYNNSEEGIQCNLLYNQIGRRIVFIGFPDNNLPDSYENSRPLLDLQFSKTVGRLSVSLSLSDIINLPRYIYWDLNNNGKLDKEILRDGAETGVKVGTSEYKLERDVVIIRNQPGRTMGLGLTYRL